mmetsp:Transcript_39389/g.35087  ORF Transcript_39389/g.35087 Transcript_39389/m.35087 type:complete len:380 (-) Transcript_39389:1137-2276(-)
MKAIIFALFFVAAFAQFNNSQLADYLNGVNTGLDLGVSYSDLIECAGASQNATQEVLPIIRDIENKDYESAIEDLLGDIPDLERDNSECSSYNEAWLNKVLLPLYDNFKNQPGQTLEQLGLNVLENFETLNHTSATFESQLMSQNFFDAGETYANMINTVLKGVIPNNNYTSFFRLGSDNYTYPHIVYYNYTELNQSTEFDYQEFNATKFLGDYLKGISEGLGFQVNDSAIYECADAQNDFGTEIEFPLIELLQTRNYTGFLEQLAEDIPEIEDDYDECKPYNAEYLSKLLLPIYNSFKNKPEYTLKTLFLNVLENFNQLKNLTEAIGNDMAQMKSLQAGKDYAQLIQILFQGIITPSDDTIQFDYDGDSNAFPNQSQW